MKIYLPNAASLQNFEGMLARFDPEDETVLEFSMHKKWVNVHPAAISFAACLAHHVTVNGGIHSGTIHPVKSLPYVKRMRLFDYLQLNAGANIVEHEEAGRFIPLQRITNTKELSDFIVNMIPLLHAKPEEVEPIRYVISELTRNVLEHSRSTEGAFLCAQFYKESKTLSLGIADAGVGIRTALSRSYGSKTDFEALKLAMWPGITGTTRRMGGDEYNAGAGLFFTKSIACASRNYFMLYSGSAMFKLKPLRGNTPIALHADVSDDHHTRCEGLPRWHGTVVGIDVSIEQDIKFKDLMDLIRKAFSVDVRKKKKERYRTPRFT